MHRRVVPILCVFFLLSFVGFVTSSSAATLMWDHPAPSTVTGYAVTVDGVRTDYGLSVAGSGGACSCSATIPLAAGTHTIVVTAYSTAGQTASAPLTVNIAGSTPPPVTPPPAPSPTLPTGWLTQDIGAVGAAGTASVNNGTYTVTGAGADIWFNSDSFRYVYQTLSGNQTIVARVTAMQNTNPYAKAGVMIRETTAGGSSHALLNMRPNGVIEFISRNGTGTDTTLPGTTTQAAPVWLKLARSGDTISASVSRDGSTWTAVGSTTVSMGATINVGLAVCSHIAGTLNTATFDSVTIGATSGSTPPPVTPPPPTSGGALPSPWTSNDVGAAGLSGSGAYTNGTFTVTGAGADVWGTADSFQYVSQPFAGDGSVTARVVRMDNTSRFAKAGVMLRGALNASAQNVVLNLTPNGSIEFMSRTAAGSATTYLGSAGQTPPTWLRLARAGSVVTASVSANGSTWTNVGSVTVNGLALAGLFVNSHDVNVRNTATFDNVAVAAAGGGGGGGTSSSEIVIYAADVATSALRGSFTRVASSSAAGGVRLQTPDTGVANTNNALASPADYVDVTFNATAGVPYTLWLRMRATSNSKYADSAWVQFSDARANGSQVYAIGSTSALLVNLATDAAATSLSDWGWTNGAYWFAQPRTFTFGRTGAQTLRIQTREDGFQIDQIVLSPSRYLSQAPGGPTADTTIVPK